MDPIEDWCDKRDAEIMAGGKPTVCIMGTDDFAKMCGAIGAMHHLETPITMTGKFRFQDCIVMESRSVREGMFFA